MKFKSGYAYIEINGVRQRCEIVGSNADGTIFEVIVGDKVINNIPVGALIPTRNDE